MLKIPWPQHNDSPGIYDIMYHDGYDPYYNVVTQTLAGTVIDTGQGHAQASMLQQQKDSDGNIHISTFLPIDNSLSVPVDPNTLTDKPFVLDYDPITDNAVHPKYDNSKSVDENIAEQSKYKIGKVEHVIPGINGYLCKNKITDARAAEFAEMFPDKSIPVSAQILLTAEGKPEYTHLAAASKNNTATKVITTWS
jgi:hypothetical protein